MRKGRPIYYVVWLLLGMLIILAACGSSSEESVRKKMEKQLTQIEGYKAKAEMVMKTGQEERSYDIDVWFQRSEDGFYRVDLTNEADDHRQTILKNDEGVFVLTPVMNKSFKFQSDWPAKNGQPYLYESLIQDITEDKEASFVAEDEFYRFKTKTNYMNEKHLPYQHVFIDKKTYLPMYVQVLGEDETPLIEVKFHDIDVNPTFSEADFNREAILEAAQPEETDEENDKEEDEDTEETTDVAASTAGEDEAVAHARLLPVETKGAELIETEEVTEADSTRTIMTFKGDRNFTLIQEQQDVVPVGGMEANEVHGDPIHLGHSVGAISADMVAWHYKGSQFYLASTDLTIDELIEVASSVYGREVK